MELGPDLEIRDGLWYTSPGLTKSLPWHILYGGRQMRSNDNVEKIFLSSVITLSWWVFYFSGRSSEHSERALKKRNWHRELAFTALKLAWWEEEAVRSALVGILNYISMASCIPLASLPALKYFAEFVFMSSNNNRIFTVHRYMWCVDNWRKAKQNMLS